VTHVTPRQLLGFVAGLLLIAALGCGSEAPTQPAPLTDCTTLGIVSVSSLSVGEGATLRAYQEGCRPMFLPLPRESVVWQSLDPSTATVAGDVVTGLAPGPAVIQATYGLMTQQTLVVVGGDDVPPGSAVPVRVRMYGAPVMVESQQARFGVFAEFADGTVSSVSSSAVWTSSRPAIAGFPTATGSGWQHLDTRPVDAYAVGTTRLTATYRGLTTSVTVDVQRRP
jgi:hypothetical protein